MKKSWIDEAKKMGNKDAIEGALLRDREAFVKLFDDGLSNTSQEMMAGKTIDTFDRIMAGRVKYLDLLNETLLKQSPKPVQCESKCSYCCYQHVAISSTEAFHIVRWMKAHNLELNFEANARLVAELPHLERFQRAIACPALKNKKCSIYEVRPMPCRSYFSTTRHLCKQGWIDRWKENATGSDILLQPQLMAHSFLLGSDAAFYIKGHHMVTLELADALAQASQPGAFESWFFDSERIFIEPSDNNNYSEVLSAAYRQTLG